jgi:hypothetical protein
VTASRVSVQRLGRIGDDALTGVLLVGVLAAGLAVFMAREGALAGTRGFPLDDSWIHLRFARNLAEGAGFSYNPGVPVSGSTAPLWTVLLAGAFWLGADGLASAKAVGVALAAGVVLATWRLATAWTRSRGLGLLAGVLVAGSGPLLWGALSGMEVVLAALLTTAGLLAHTQNRAWAAGALTGLACLARPEAGLLLPLIWLAGPVTARRTLAVAAPTVATLAPWVAFNLWTTGQPFPATAAAKVEGGLLAALSGIREPVREALLGRPLAFAGEWATWLWSVNALLPLLVLPGLAALWVRAGRSLALPASVLLVHPLAMALLAAYRGPGFQEGRYSIHLLPLAFAVAVTALTPPGPVAAAGRGARPLRRGLALGLIAAGALAIGPAASRYGWAVQNIDAMQVHLGHWVHDRTPPAARLALNDVGAIAYLSRREVVDLMGLVSPAIIAARRQGEAGILEFLDGACPDYLVIFPDWFPALATRTDYFTPIHRVRLAHNTVAGSDEMVVYETVWNRWRAAPRPCGDPRTTSRDATRKH